MVTNVNLRVPTGDAADRSPLVDQLAKKADVNRDGTVTSAEFTAFLSTLMKSLDDELKAADEPDVRNQAERPAVPPALTGVHPASSVVAIEALRRAIAGSQGE